MNRLVRKLNFSLGMYSFFTEWKAARLQSLVKVAKFSPKEDWKLKQHYPCLDVVVLLGNELETSQIIYDILSQTYKRSRFIFVSPTKILPIKIKKELRKSNVSFIHCRDLGIGPAAARNLAFGTIESEFVVFMEAGVHYYPNYLHSFAQAFSENPNKNFFFSDYLTVDSNNNTTFQLSELTQIQLSEWIPSSRTVGFICKEISKLHRWPEYLDYHGEDTVWVSRFLDQEEEIVFINVTTASWTFDLDNEIGKETMSKYAFGDGQSGVRDNFWLGSAFLEPWRTFNASYWRGFASRPKLDKRRDIRQVRVFLVTPSDLKTVVSLAFETSSPEECRVVLAFLGAAPQYISPWEYNLSNDSTTVLPLSFEIILPVLQNYREEGFDITIYSKLGTIAGKIALRLIRNISGVTLINL